MGAINDAGDDATGDDTSCTPVTCRKNEHVAGHKCVPCSENEIKDAGDLATGKDTSCVPTDQLQLSSAIQQSLGIMILTAIMVNAIQN